MGNNSLKTFEELKCWQACREVRIFIMNIVKSYPKEEKYSIVDNMNGYINYLNRQITNNN
jgi:hypothetical protein